MTATATAGPEPQAAPAAEAGGHQTFVNGPVPPVATGNGAPAGPTASEQAYGGHEALAFAAHVTGKQPSAEGAAAQAKLKAKLKAQYGTDVHDFNKVMMGRNKLEQQMRAALPGVTARLNEVAAERKLPFRFTEAELATNFLAEGGVLLMTGQPRASIEAGGEIDGFSYLGIDTFASRRAQLKPWMSKDLASWSADPKHGETSVNEKGQTAHSMMIRDIPQGVEANAVMFAGARAEFAKVCAAEGVDTSSLSEEAWFFWTTVCYNGGAGTAKKLLKQHGIDYWKEPYKGKPNGQSAKYNASWRTATWDYARQTEGDHLDGKVDHDKKPDEKPDASTH